MKRTEIKTTNSPHNTTFKTKTSVVCGIGSVGFGHIVPIAIAAMDQPIVFLAALLVCSFTMTASNAFVTTPPKLFLPSVVDCDMTSRISLLRTSSSLLLSPLSSSSNAASLLSSSAMSVSREDGTHTAIVNWDKVTNEWELDCYSRPVLVEGKKKLWEILITDSSGNMKICRSLPSNK